MNKILAAILFFCASQSWADVIKPGIASPLGCGAGEYLSGTGTCDAIAASATTLTELNTQISADLEDGPHTSGNDDAADAQVAIDTTTHAAAPDAHFVHASDLIDLNNQISASIADGAHTIDTSAAITCTGSNVLEGSGACVANGGVSMVLVTTHTANPIVLTNVTFFVGIATVTIPNTGGLPQIVRIIVHAENTHNQDHLFDLELRKDGVPVGVAVDGNIVKTSGHTPISWHYAEVSSTAGSVEYSVHAKIDSTGSTQSVEETQLTVTEN